MLVNFSNLDVSEIKDILASNPDIKDKLKQQLEEYVVKEFSKDADFCDIVEVKEGKATLKLKAKDINIDVFESFSYSNKISPELQEKLSDFVDAYNNYSDQLIEERHEVFIEDNDGNDYGFDDESVDLYDADRYFADDISQLKSELLSELQEEINMEYNSYVSDYAICNEAKSSNYVYDTEKKHVLTLPKNKTIKIQKSSYEDRLLEKCQPKEQNIDVSLSR